jgi:hypothetical protein
MKKALLMGFVALGVATTFVSCVKSGANGEPLTAVTGNQPANKQIVTVNFGSGAPIANGRGITTTPTGTTGNTGAYFVTNVYTLNQFETAVPQISIYGTFEGAGINTQNVALSISTSTDQKYWSDWRPAPFNVDAESTTQNIAFSPVDVDKAVRYVKFKVEYLENNLAISNAKLYFYNPGVTAPEVLEALKERADLIATELSANQQTQNNASTLCNKPGFTTRSSWGARAATSTPSTTTVNFLIIHHENGANTSTDWPARVRSVQNFHMDTNGWADIGYNYLVDPNGITYEGRGGGENVVGAHNCGKNTNTMGVCMLGTFTSVKPTNNAEYSLKRIMAWKAKQRGIDVTSTGNLSGKTVGRLTGHRASCSTSCPGDMLWNDLARLRTDIKTNFVAKCN